ncbi:MAG: hypothetical protein JST44_23270 [Cyanobacteria bacterium SZAS LIN-5]|nr:hypothetical protein [Cyanobacteria bacterium SZAS LIN-5]
MLNKNAFGIAAVAAIFFFCAQASWAVSEKSSEFIDGWTKWRTRPTHTVSIDPGVVYADHPSVKLQTDQDSKDQFGLFQNFRAEKYVGKRVRFSGYLKTEKIRDWSGIWMVVEDADESPLSMSTMEKNPAKGTSTWKKYSLVLDVPKNACSVMIGCAQTGPGKTWISNLSLEPVSRNVKTTASAVDEEKFPVSGRLGEKPDLTFKSGRAEVRGVDLLNWSSHSSSDYAIDADAVNLFRDAKTGRISATAESPRGFATFYQRIRAEDYRGKKLRFSGSVKTKDISDWCGLWMRVDGGGSVLAFDNMESRPIKGTTEWTNYSVVLPVPANAHRITYGFMQSGSGSSWLAAPSLDVVGEQVATTSMPSKTLQIPRPDLLGQPKLEFKN